MIVDGDYRPIVVLPCVMGKRKVKFLGPDKEQMIEGEWARIAKKVLKYCNGNYTISDIAHELDADEDIVIDLIRKFDSYGIAMDSREQYKHFHKVSSFPTTFSNFLAQDKLEDLHEEAFFRHGATEKNFKVTSNSSKLRLMDELTKRKSCRNFKNQNIALWQILELCKLGYSQVAKGHFSVPSAGGLYPLRIYVIVGKPLYDELGHEAAQPGYYMYNPGHNELEEIGMNADTIRLKFCFNDEELLDNTVQIVISADVDFMAQKYANRAYRFCLLEAGHVAQNMILAAIEMGLATCEMGGVLDDAIAKELDFFEPELPLIAMVVGYPAPEKECMNYARFIEENVGEDKPVKSLAVWNDGGDYWIASAVYGDNVCIANGRARSEIMAKFKAVVEGYERYAMINDAWAENSCGIAAHFSIAKAKKAALSELIERDAIMYCWENKGTTNAAFDKIKPLSYHTRRRVRELWGEGRDVSVLRLVSPEAPYIPVLLVAITGNYYPYFVCGAACDVDVTTANAREKLCEAEDKALMEAEAMLLYYLKNPESGKVPKLTEIESPEDHGKLYRISKRAAKKIRWLTEREQMIYDVESTDFPDSYTDELDKKLEVNYRTVTEFDNGLVVIKAESPKLAKMSFGTNGEKILPHFFS